MSDRMEARDRMDLFKPLSQRSPKGVYFIRIADYNGETDDYIWRIHELARSRGAIIEGQITNPDERQLGYYNDAITFQKMVKII